MPPSDTRRTIFPEGRLPFSMARAGKSFVQMSLAALMVSVAVYFLHCWYLDAMVHEVLLWPFPYSIVLGSAMVLLLIVMGLSLYRARHTKQEVAHRAVTIIVLMLSALHGFGLAILAGGLTPTSIVAAIIRHDERALRLMLEDPPEPTGAYAQLDPPQFLVVGENKPDLLRVILEHGEDPNVTNDQGITPLFLAVHHGKHECARTLLEYGADPNLPERRWPPPLFQAVADGDADLVKLLLEYGADPLHPWDAETTPLSHAREKGNHDIVALLEEAVEQQQAAREVRDATR